MKVFRPFLFFLVFTLISSGGHALTPYKPKRFRGFSEGLMGGGLLLGDPTGIRALYFTNWKRAFSLSAGYSFAHVGVGSLDYLFYGYSVEDKRKTDAFWNSLIFYGGAGFMGGAGVGGHAVEDQSQMGLRLVGGVEYVFGNSPWSLRLEGAPQYLFKGKNSLGLAGGLGITYYFFEKPKKNPGRFKKDEPEEDFSEFE
jgi:hypothetical protein